MTDLPPTERRDPRSVDLDRLGADGVLALMAAADAEAVAAVDAAGPQISEAAQMVAETYLAGGSVAYLGAGTSGHLALLDAAELPATFGVAGERFRALVATGSFRGRSVVATSEDDVDAVSDAIDGTGFGPGDVVLGVAASGTTPFVVAGLERAAGRGCRTIGIANNPDTPVLEGRDVAILLDSGPEVVTGSTRLKAGTAQKLTLNRISTTAMVLADRVISNLMVEVRPGPEKLRHRCVRIVVDLTGVTDDEARALLEVTDWSIREAIARVVPQE